MGMVTIGSSESLDSIVKTIDCSVSLAKGSPLTMKVIVCTPSGGKEPDESWKDIQVSTGGLIDHSRAVSYTHLTLPTKA